MLHNRVSYVGSMWSVSRSVHRSVGRSVGRSNDCYCIYVDKYTLAQLINSYQSHAKRGDDGTLSGYSPLLTFPPHRAQLGITPSINPSFIDGRQAVQFWLRFILFNFFQDLLIYLTMTNSGPTLDVKTAEAKAP